MTADVPEVLIVGGGLAGSAAAIVLAQAGRSILLVEREAQPQHKVCGEFFSREALAYLAWLQVDAVALGAVPIHFVRFAGRLGSCEAPLPFAALSLTRRRLDEELLRSAALSGARIVRGHAAELLEQHASGWRAKLDDGSIVSAPTAFLATGKHDLRGWPRPSGRQPDLIAFKMYWRLAAAELAALEDRVELHLYRGGYAGLQPVEDGAANLCCLIRRAELQRLGGGWNNLLRHMQAQCPQLRCRLHGAHPLLPRPLAVSAIPYGFVREHANGAWALGDQAAVIPSFTGDGMSIALHSGCLAAAMYLRGETAEAFQQRLHDELAPQVSLATKLSRGLVAEPQKTLLQAAARFWPGALRLVAEHTRLSEAAMGTRELQIGQADV